MKVALVWPKGFDPVYVVPMSLGYLKSNTPGHDVRIFDLTLKALDAEDSRFIAMLQDFKPDVVGVSCWSPTYPEAIRVLRTVKKLNPSVTTVIGGAHASSYPDRTMLEDCVDFLFRGEAELAFPVFLEQLCGAEPDWSKVMGLVYRQEAGLCKQPMQREKDHIDEIAIPDYDAIDIEGYISAGYRFNTRHKRNAPIWVTRGCPYRCTFCSAPFQNGKPVRVHSIEYVAEWIKFLYHEKNIRLMNIIDDNFTFHVNWAKDFCRAMIALDLKGLRFSTPNGIRAQRADQELFHLMKQAGWENVVVAPESGSQHTLATMKKDLDLAVIEERISQIRKAKLKVHGFFIVGYPGETAQDLRLTQNFLRRCRFNMVFINNFQPLPGTPIYDELVASGQIEDGLLPKNYSDGERVYTPDALRDFNFPRFVLSNYLYMMLREPTNIVYMMRLISMKMIGKKVYRNLRSMLFSRASARPECFGQVGRGVGS